MPPDQPPVPTRRTVLRGAALAALTIAGPLSAARPQPAAAAVGESFGSVKSQAAPPPSYSAITGLL